MDATKETTLTLNGETLTDEVILTMAESFKALADPTRLRILALLSEGGMRRG